MAQCMALKSNAFKAAVRPQARRCTARAPVAVRATKHEVSLTERLAPALLAGIVAFTGVSPAFTPPARAEDEEMLSPYQKRQLEMERRRELLREARERAAARAAGVEVDEPATPAAAAQPKEEPTDFSAQAARLKQESLKAYEDAAKNRPTITTTPAEPEESSTPAPSFPKFGGFSFSKPAEAPAPAAVEAPPAPQPAAPAPKPAVVPPPPAPVRKIEEKKPEPATPAVEKKQQQTAAVSKKRRGPLPLWFAEILVLGAYVGLGLAATKYSEQTGKVLTAVWVKIVELYSAVEKLVNRKSQPSA